MAELVVPGVLGPGRGYTLVEVDAVVWFPYRVEVPGIVLPDVLVVGTAEESVTWGLDREESPVVREVLVCVVKLWGIEYEVVPEGPHGVLHVCVATSSVSVSMELPDGVDPGCSDDSVYPVPGLEAGKLWVCVVP